MKRRNLHRRSTNVFPGSPTIGSFFQAEGAPERYGLDAGGLSIVPEASSKFAELIPLLSCSVPDLMTEVTHNAA